MYTSRGLSINNRMSTMSTSGALFRFTKNAGKLSHAQRLFYERNGYLMIPRLVPQEILDKCSSRFNDIVVGKVPAGLITVVRDVVDRKLVNKIQNINHDVVFREYIEYTDLLDYVEAFTGPHIMAVHNMLIAKPPDAGVGSSKHPPHQDLYYFPFRPADLVVAAWTAIEPCDKENGCLFVSPGSHTSDRLYPHDYPPGVVNKFYHGIQDLPSSTTWVYLEMLPGDTVFFHPLLIHGSGINVSNRTRKAISCHYASSDCHYINVKNDTVQKRIEEEAMPVLRAQHGLDENISYADIWRFKSTLVRGIRSSL